MKQLKSCTKVAWISFSFDKATCYIIKYEEETKSDRKYKKMNHTLIDNNYWNEEYSYV